MNITDLTNKATNMVGKTIDTIIADQQSTDPLNEELNKHDLTKRKGSVGVVLEWLLLGTRGDNKSVADFIHGDDAVDIKAVYVKKKTARSKSPCIPGLSGYSFKENLRLTKANYSTIQTESFADSSLNHKRRMMVVLLEKHGPNLGDTVVVSVGMIDLTSVIDTVESDYNWVAEECRKGRASQLTSSQKQPNKIAQLYSSGASGKPMSYMCEEGQQHSAKPKAFYLFKSTLSDLYQPCIVGE